MEDLKRVFIKGGILSPSELKQIISYAESLDLDALHFGSRQDIVFPAHEINESVDAQFPELSTTMISDPSHQNIVCSYVASDIFPSTGWLNGSTFLYILENFKHRPELKVNISDPRQKLVPIFNGQLNFIASKHEDYWYLELNLPSIEGSVYYPVLVYSWDIAKTARIIEEVYEQVSNEQDLFLLVNKQFQANNRTIESELKTEFKPFPYYEGMNKMEFDQYWLGLYWRNNRYDLAFLKKFCNFCLENKVGKICLTPWKSFIVKGIPKDSKLRLEKLLGKSGINIRHSLLELNWHLPVNDEEALKLKQYIVRNFDQNDISTYGLTFAIEDRSKKNEHFTSIVIEKNQQPNLVKEFDVRPTYNVLYSESFDPNTQKYLVYAQDVDMVELPGLLMELSKMYFSQFNDEDGISSLIESVDEEILTEQVYQCSDCLSVYSEDYGDVLAGVGANISFEELPDSYTCGVCESPKSKFEKVNI